MEVLFQGLVRSFRSSVTLRMISGGEVELYVQGFSERTEEPGDEFGPTVGGNMLRNSVFGEHMSNEQNCKVFGGTMDSCWNEDTLLGKAVNNHQD